MFKNFKKNDKYTTIALYTFFVVLATVILVFLFINFKSITSAIAALISAISAFIYGFVIAYICNPIYNFFNVKVFKFTEKNGPKPILRKTLSLIMTYIVFFLIIALIVMAIVPSFAKNLESLASNLQEYIQTVIDFISNFLEKLSVNVPVLNAEEIENNLLQGIQEFFKIGGKDADGNSTGLVQSIINVGSSVISQIFFVIVGFILSVYFLSSKERITAKFKKLLCSVLKKESYEKFIGFLRYTDKTFGRYILGTIADSIVVGIVVFGVLQICGFSFAPLIGVIVGVTNIIPFFGPFLGGIPSGLIILIADGPFRLFFFIVFIVVVQQIDGNIIAPHIHSASTGLSPIGVIAAVTVCSHLFGFVGMVIGVPLCAVLAYIFEGFINKKLSRKNLPTDIELYNVPDIYSDEKFNKASIELEGLTKIEQKEAEEKAKLEEVLHKVAVAEVHEKLLSDKENSSQDQQDDSIVSSPSNIGLNDE